MSEMTATQEALERFCDNCVVRDQVRGSHGIMDRLNEIEKKQVELNVKLARLEWLVPCSVPENRKSHEPHDD